MIRQVYGTSMLPSLRPGDIVVTRNRAPKLNDIVIARQGGREIIKRVVRIPEGKYYLVGDNKTESTDSRHYGFVNKSDILGVIMIILPKSIAPPKLVRPYGLWLGRCVAAILIVMAVIHLFRIDTFIPLLDEILPGAGGVATFVGLVVICSEIFAIPFALRMKLSPLAHLMSGALVVFAALWWLLLTIWAYGMGSSTGQLGEFVYVPANGLMLTLNFAWVVLSYVTLYTLGYNRLKIADMIRSLNRK